MKKIISLLVVLAMLMSMAPAVFATETTEYQEVTILEAIELAEEGSDTKYLVRGTVTSVVNTTYGNLYIEDAEGNSLYVYGLYSVDGVTRYDAMETKPQAGDEVLLLGVLTTYNSNPQMKNAWLQELNGEAFEAPETEPDPEADTELTVAEAIALGASKAHNTYTEGKYYVTGEVTEIYNTTYGNMYIADEEGNTLTIYGTYDADGTNRFDAMENQPAVGDTITVYGIIGQYNGTPQMKNGWIQEAAEEEPEAPVEGPLEGNVLVEGNNKLAAYESATEYTFTATQAGTLYLTIRNYTCNGVEYGERMLEYKWSQILVDGVALTAMQTTLEVTEGQVLSIEMTTDYDNYVSNLYLSFEGFYQEPEGSAFNPIKVFPGDCPLNAEIGAGEEVYYHLSYENYDDNSFTDDHILYVYGEDAYVVYEGWVDGARGDIYVYAENGVVTYAVWNGYDIRIGNAGDAAATFEVDAEIPVGAQGNPAQLVLGDNVTEMTADVTRYFYTWTAEAPGTLTLTVSGDSYWNISAENLIAGDYYYQSEKRGDEGVINFVVAKGDVITIYLALYNNDYESIDGTLTLNAAFVEGQGEDLSLHLENNFVKVRNNYGPAVTKDYTYVAEQTGTLYITFRSFGTYGYYWEESRLSDEYYLQCVNIFINGVQTTVFQNSVEVTEGDSVVVTIASLDGYPYEANIWLSYEGFYEEPVGSDLNPVVVDIEELPTDTVEIPAGEDLHYKFTGDCYDYTLYIYGEDAYIVVKQYNYETDATEEVYIYAENGVVEYALKYSTEFRIGNAGEAANTFYMEATIPLGIYSNPDALIIGEQVAPVPADYNGYWYTWTAPEAGTLTVTVTGEGWGFELSNSTTYTYIYRYEMNGESNTASIDVAAGDVIMLNVLILGPNGWGDYPGGELTVVAEFVAEGGGEEAEPGTEANPIEIVFEMNETYTVGTATATVAAGETTYYFAYGVGGMILTVTDAEGNVIKTETLPGNPRVPANFSLTNDGETEMTYTLTVTYPAGTYDNPAELVLGYTSVEVGGNGYFYTWTATEDTLLALSMLSNNWTYSFMIEHADGTYTYTDIRYSDDEVPVQVTVLKLTAGDVVKLTIGTVDWSAATVEFNANTYAGTAENPVCLELIPNGANTAWALNADLPAGEYVYSMNIMSSIFELTINGELTSYTTDPMGWDPATVVINNTEETNAVFEIELNYPAGTMYNPDELELGYQEGQMIMFDSLSHWYSYTATEDTLLAIELMGENWYYWGVYMNADGSFDFSRMTTTYYADADPLVPMTVIKLAAGETFALCIGTIDGSEIVEFSAMTYAGTEEDPVLFNYCWIETETGMALNADLPAGEYVYGARNINAMTLTVNGVETEFVPGQGRMPCIFTINNTEAGVVALELNMPVGSMDNPEVVEDGEHTVEIEEGTFAEYWYSYIAPGDGTLTVTVSSTGGYVFAVNNETAGIYGDYQWSNENPVNPMTIDVKEGDVVMIMVGAYDPELGMGAGATITVDLLFTPKPDVVLGDVNGDGSVDTTDAKLVMQYDLGLIDETGLELAAADVNGDGSVDTTDAKLIMQLDLGLITEFPKP